MTGIKVDHPGTIRSHSQTSSVRTVLTGVVQNLSLRGPGGNAAPSGTWLVLNKPVTVGERRFDKVFLGPSELQIGGQYTLAGDLKVVTKVGVPSTIHWAVLENATKMEVEP